MSLAGADQAVGAVVPAYGLAFYGLVGLKTNYLAEYMTGLLASAKDDKDKSAVHLNECRRMGIRVLCRT